MTLDLGWLVFTAEGNESPRFARIAKVPSRETLAQDLYSSKGKLRKVNFYLVGTTKRQVFVFMEVSLQSFYTRPSPFLISQWFQL